MASLGQSTPSTRNRESDLPDPAAEKRELRRMVQELEAENERLRKALRYADDRYDPVYEDFFILKSAADLLEEEQPALSDELRVFRRKLMGALDGGGDKP